MFKSILVAIDGSSLSQEAIAKAIELSLLSGAGLDIVTVSSLDSHSHWEGSSLWSEQQIAEAHNRSVAVAQALVDAGKKDAHARGVVSAEAFVIRSKHVAESIIEHAKSHDCDLIVMGCRGHGGFARLLLGSETLHVLTHSQTPVLVLRWS